MKRPALSQQQTIEIVAAVVKAIESYALHKGARLSRDEIDDYTDFCCRVVPQALVASGCDLPWFNINSLRKH
jgi:hypothetical protein